MVEEGRRHAMDWVIVALEAWLLPAVLVLCFMVVLLVRERCFGLLVALRRRQAGQDVGDEPRPRLQ